MINMMHPLWSSRNDGRSSAADDDRSRGTSRNVQKRKSEEKSLVELGEEVCSHVHHHEMVRRVGYEVQTGIARSYLRVYLLAGYHLIVRFYRLEHLCALSSFLALGLCDDLLELLKTSRVPDSDGVAVVDLAIDLLLTSLRLLD